MNGTAFCRTFYYTAKVECDYCRDNHDGFYPVFYESLQKKANTDVLALLADELEKLHRSTSRDFKKRLESAARNLRALINMEQNKNPAVLEPSWKSIYNTVAAKPLSGTKSAYDGGSSTEASLALISRMEKTMFGLKDFLENPDPVRIPNFDRIPLLVSKRFSDLCNQDLKQVFRSCRVQIIEDDTPVLAATDYLSDYMRTLLPAIRNLRIFALDKKKKYRSEIHDDFFKFMDWTDFTKEELSLCPPLIYLDTEDGCAALETGAFYKLLTLGANIKVFMFKTAAPGTVELLKPAEMAMALNSVYVFQSSADQLPYFQKGLTDGLLFPGSAFFFHLLPDSSFTADFLAGAAASRYFPDFCFNPALVEKWGVKPDLSGNQQAEKDWLNLQFTIDNKTENASFSYADFLFTQVATRELFMVIPEEWQPENLVLLVDYLGLEIEQQCESLPFILLRNAEGKISRAICSRAVVQACQERLGNWRILRKLADKSLERANQESERKIAELELEHAGALKKEAEKTARNVLDKLASVLLDLSEQDKNASVTDLEKKAELAEVKSTVLKQGTPASVPASVPAPVLIVSSEELEESWIDSPSCVACGECININGAMFKYDDDKKAYIDDVKAGSFAQLVQAAESCALSLIHPGDPWNPDEPGLENLLKRAKPFCS